MTSYGVDSYHINCGPGDCAIHVLVSNPSTNPQAVKVILIDGGKSRATTRSNIPNTINILGERYKFALRFDAIVITHWDDDHFAGILSVIRAELKEKAKVKPLPPVGSMQVSFLKYDVGGKPATVWYCPYWSLPGIKANGPPKSLRLSNMIVEIYFAGRGWVPLCVLKSGDLRGVNFLNNKPLPATKTPESITSPAVLVAQNPPGDPDVGIYCVAVNKLCLGPVGAEEIIDAPGTTETNLRSVCAMVIWTGGRISHYFAGDAEYTVEEKVVRWSQVGQKREVTSMKMGHHGAVSSTPTDMLGKFQPKNLVISCGSDYGHPRWEVLLYLSAWIQSLGIAASGRKPVYCTCYPYYILQDAKQEWVIPKVAISTKVFSRTSKSVPAQTYLDKLGTLYAAINNSTARDGGPQVAEIYKRFTAFMEGESNKNPKPTPEKAKTLAFRWIVGQVAECWGAMSHITAASHEASSASVSGSNTTAVQGTSTAIVYIKVECRKEEGGDGKVAVRRAGDQTDTQHNTPPAIPSKHLQEANKTQNFLKRKYLDNGDGRGSMGAATASNHYTAAITGSSKRSKNIIELPQVSDISSQLLVEGPSAPPTPSMVIQHPASVSETNEGYYIFCSELQEAGPGVTVLASGELDDFVQLLHRGVIGVAKQPTAASHTAFLDTDELFLWLYECIGATSFTVRGDHGSNNITEFSLILSAIVNGGQSIMFSSGCTNAAFDTGRSVPESGLIPGAGALVLGLNPGSFKILHMTLNQVFDYTGMTPFVESRVLNVLGGTALSLKAETANGNRNAVWFDPGHSYQTNVRLQFTVENLSEITQFFSVLTGFTVTSAKVIAKIQKNWVMASDGIGILSEGEVILTAECTVTVPSSTVSFSLALALHETATVLTLTTVEYDTLETIASWIIGVAGHGPLDLTSWIQRSGSFGLPQLRRIQITMEGEMVVGFSIEMELELHFGKAPDAGSRPVVFLFRYCWYKGQTLGTLSGDLWCGPPEGLLLVAYASVMSDWEHYLEFQPRNPNACETLDLRHLIPGTSGGVANIPNGIPTEICQASIEISETYMSFYGAVACEPPPPGDIPTIYLGKIGLGAQYTWGTDSSFELSFEMKMLMEPPEGSPNPTVNLIGTVDYTRDSNGGSWVLTGELSYLYASTLYSFFDKDSRDGVMTFLEQLEIQYLTLEYHYEPTNGGAAKQFKFSGIILLGEMELDLDFNYDNAGWTFNARVGENTTQDTTVGSIVQSILGNEVVLPSFVSNIAILSPTSGDGVTITCQKMDDHLFFAASVQLGILSFTFSQYREIAWAKTIKPKRVIKISVHELPSLEVPLVGSLAQPFDEMFYMWVQDESEKNISPAHPGLTRDEVTKINGALTNDKLLFKERSKNKLGSDVVIRTGHHFVLVLNNARGDPDVVIDYVFGIPSAAAPSDSEAMVPAKEGPPEPGDGGDSGSSMAAYKKSMGPLSIRNIGFKYKDNILSVLMDATFELGPIGMSILGFSIGIDFGSDFTLQKLPPWPSIVVSLSGLAVEFDRPPISIAGLFEYVDAGGQISYNGGIIIAFSPYLFEAAGCYGETSGQGGFKSVFIFGTMSGPLITLEFATISGVTGGFGYNTAVKFPAISEVPSFPFLSMPTVDAEPMGTLKALTQGPWFSSQPDSFWVCAGLTVTAFEVLTLEAVVVIEWNPYVKLGLFGVGSADIPGGTGETFGHVEFGILATVDFEAGVMNLEAQLSPNSYLLDPNCHLTGGFALYYCWKSGTNQNVGDWVFTIGGYNPAFQPPSQYPNPPRLGISWSLDDSLSITGQSYFAITPKACMGGSRMHVALSVGPLDAWFDAYADFLINYKPFHFMGDGGVSVGVSYTLDCLFVSIPLKLEISCQLYLEGPPMGGRVHVNFWVFGFDINFGPSPDPVLPVSIAGFYDLVLQSDTPNTLSTTNLFAAPASQKHMIMDVGDAGTNQPHLFSCVDGLLTAKDQPQKTVPNTPWQVRSATLEFIVACRFAIDSATIAHPTVNIEYTDNAIYSKPMQLTTPIHSKLDIEITRDGDKTPEDDQIWRMKRVLKAVPDALWGIYDSSQDPSQSGNNISGMLSGTDVAITLMMGVSIFAPMPTLCQDLIPAFDALKAMSQSVFDQGKEPIFPPANISEEPSWEPLEGVGGEQQWVEAKNTWKTPRMGKESQQKSVDLWLAAMFWTEKLDGAMPALLNENFDDIYLAAPLLSVVGGRTIVE